MITTTAKPPRVFVEPATLFSLHVPEQWLIDTCGQQGTKVVLLHPTPEADFCANVNVTIQDLRGLTADEFLTLGRLQLKQLTGLPKPDRDEPARRPAGAHLMEWSARIGPLHLRTRQLIVINGKMAYLVTATAPAVSFPVYVRDFDTVLDSFEVRGTV